MKLELIIKEELKVNIEEARKDPLFKDPKINLKDEKIVSITDCIRIAERYAMNQILLHVPVWNPISQDPSEVGFYHVYNDYPGVNFPIDRAYWDGVVFRPINDNHQILSLQNFNSLTHWTEPLAAPVTIEDNND
ncbi:hypothetical protein N180_02810 [Pedobacter antarcticus 4BY]|uniref:Uncharacterized protein n=2 Tax=Pedobacter antarcticus TaxID=34086 RepID=A0A081PKH3_9SPHI|nr:hypothetical protein [Pedobacter antarcticus]KEQ31196.1 hypothetical protein N180_02810 [Pedobacter antarcticus 4BY]SFE54629.1 hypothetical protein SAMN03003324_00850 [Pedobacter antarcticus]